MCALTLGSSSKLRYKNEHMENTSPFNYSTFYNKYIKCFVFLGLTVKGKLKPVSFKLLLLFMHSFVAPSSASTFKQQHSKSNLDPLYPEPFVVWASGVISGGAEKAYSELFKKSSFSLAASNQLYTFNCLCRTHTSDYP